MGKKYYLGEQAVRVLDKVLPYISQQMRTTKFGKETKTPLFGRGIFLGKITSAGPEEEEDFTDPRYWVREVIIIKDDNDYASILTAEDFAYPEKPSDTTIIQWSQVTRWVVATNLAELVNNTHVLSTDDDVFVLIQAKEDQTFLSRYYFLKSVPPYFFGKITGASVITTNRWKYSFVEMQPLNEGLFSILIGGITGFAYNTFEANNAACGLLGSGDNCSVFPTGITEQPLGVGAVVEIRSIMSCEEPPVLIYQFTAPNNAGGTCT